MSYCRFSSDNYRCDVYVYFSVGDYFAIHVAANRVVGEIPKVPRLGTVTGDEWLKAHKAQMDFLDTANRQSIGLPHDGQSLKAADAEDAVATLEMLKSEGYYVPEYAIEALREEIEPEATPIQGDRWYGCLPKTRSES